MFSQVTVQLVKHIYARDSRRPFCSPTHWLARQVNIQADKVCSGCDLNMWTFKTGFFSVWKIKFLQFENLKLKTEITYI